MKKNVLKKLLAIVLVFAMLAPIMGNLRTNAGLVQAADATETVGYVVVAADDVSEETIDGVKVYSSATYDGYIFAGWYTDAEATTAAASGTTGDYARFVPADVLSTKVQVTNGIVTDTANENYKDKYVMRFVSSVDSIDYKYAGFELSYTDKETKEVVTKRSKTYKAFKRIDSTTGATDNEVDTYNFSPKVVDTKSEYFITGKWPVAVADIDVDYTVRAYWMTKDGTKVYGRERCVSVNDGTKVEGQTTINLPVNLTLSKKATYTATWSDNGVGTGTVEVLTEGEGYSNIRITTTNTIGTKSLTQLYIRENDIIVDAGVQVLYRNLYTKYTGTADETWYSFYSSTDTEFVIATNADLYGLAALVNGGTHFSGKTIYVVSDIAVNPEKLEMLEGDNYLKWYTYNNENQKVYKIAPTYTWTPIGSDNQPFYGTFDAGMHTISGIYCNTTASGTSTGLFGRVGIQSNDSIQPTIKNLKLKNSYIKSVSIRTGSIAGRVENATMDNIYSNAYVESSANWVGGIVGFSYQAVITMTDCWFDGNVKNTGVTSYGTGGLIGSVYDTSILNMTNSMNTGTIDVSSCTATTPYASGFLGRMERNGTQTTYPTVTMYNCMNVGDVLINNNVTSVTTYGPFLGHRYGGFNIWDCVYVMAEDYETNAKTLSNITTSSSHHNVVRLANNQALVSKALADLLHNYNTNFATQWSTFAYSIPTLKVFEDEVFDTSWYDENKNVYVLEDKGDLYGLASLIDTTTFAGKTVKLSEDIIVNTGSADNWIEGVVPYYEWTPIGTSTDKYFAGNFDGQGHTISGVYLDTNARYAGLFGSINGSTISDFKLTNSFLKTSAGDFGSIVGLCKGSLNSVYSNATVVTSNSRAGGLAGQVNYVGATMNNCWFAGTIKNTATSGQNTGGLVGNLFGNTLTMIDCLNTGTVDISASTSTLPYVGGLIGVVSAGTTADITRCLNVGMVKQSAKTSDGYGPIVGWKIGTVTLTDVSAIGESCTHFGKSNLGTLANSIGNVYEYTVLGEAALTNSATSALVANDAWVATTYGTPVLKKFQNESDGRTDVSWFDEAEYDNTSEYILYDEADLYGFAMISRKKDFSGKTVKLGADIVVNDGTASATWATTSNYRRWMPIGSTTLLTKIDFAGTFDGQGHTISGLYHNYKSRYAGLFASVGATGIVQNLKLDNSYFKTNYSKDTEGRDIGSIAGVGAGKFYMIYSNVIMEGSRPAIGGIIGQANGSDVVLENCWFAGTVINKGTGSTGVRGTGGLVGLAYQGKLTLLNCLNSGEVNVEAYDHDQDTAEDVVEIKPHAGGLIGQAGSSDTSMEVVIGGCLNTGTIKTYSGANVGYGAIVGHSYSDALAIYSTYATTESCPNIGLSNMTAEFVQVAEADVKANAETAMPLLNWEEWTWQENELPTIIFVVSDYEEVGDATATDTDETLLTTRYENRTLYQGELHDHAKTYGNRTDKGWTYGDDGVTSLKTWIDTQISAAQLDFVASLDHQQVIHWDLDLWKANKNQLIYGTEAAIGITNKAGTGTEKMHFNLIFPDKEKLSAALNYKNLYAVNSDGYFATTGYPETTKEGFVDFLKNVKNEGGFAVVAHPKQTNFSTELLDYYFCDGVGFEVIYNSLEAQNTKDNYAAWKTLLADGKRVFACAGSDAHGKEALHNRTLTSVYADSSAATDKGNIIPYLADGNFTAGSVGIQMCMGSDTSMGGSCSFTGKRLVVGVGEFHSSVIEEDAKYRVNILNEDGVVYSKTITADENAKIAIDAEDCDFYRVEVVNATTGLRIAIGNPIWNDR